MVGSKPEFSPQAIHQLLGSFLHTKRKDAIKLLNMNGISIKATAPLKDVQIAFLKAIKDSEPFRVQASNVLATYSKTLKHDFKFVNNSQYLNYDDAEPWLGGTPSTTSTSSTTTSTSTSGTSSSGGFWKSLGTIFTPEVIQSGIKTGLGAVSTSIQSKANQTSEQNALELARLQLEQERIRAEAANKPAGAGGMSTGAIVGIVIGSIAVLGLVTWLIVRKK